MVEVPSIVNRNCVPHVNFSFKQIHLKTNIDNIKWLKKEKKKTKLPDHIMSEN